MAISYNTGATASASTAASVNLVIPAGVLASDVMLMSLTVFTEDASAPTVSFSGAGGTWTLVPMNTGTNPAIASSGAIFSYSYAYYRVATAGDPGATLTISETGSGSGTTWFGVAADSYTGASTASPIDVAFSAALHGSTTLTSPAGATGKANDWAVYLLSGGFIASGITFTGPGTQRQFVNSSAGIGAQANDSNGSVGAAGTTIGTGTWTASGGSAGNAYLGAFTIGLALPAAAAAVPYGALRQAARSRVPEPYALGRPGLNYARMP